MPERRPRRRPGENRERLLEAGLVEFGLFGYHGASTAAIASRAEVPQPHVYASFRSKRELFLGCCERAAERARRTSPEALPEPEASLVLLQSLSAARDPHVGPSLNALLRGLRTDLGEERLAAVLSAAAARLLGE